MYFRRGKKLDEKYAAINMKTNKNRQKVGVERVFRGWLDKRREQRRGQGRK